MPQHELERREFSETEVLEYLDNLNTWEAVAAFNLIEDLKVQIAKLESRIDDLRYEPSPGRPTEFSDYHPNLTKR